MTITGPWMMCKMVRPGLVHAGVKAIAVQVDTGVLDVAGIVLAGGVDRPEERRAFSVRRCSEVAAKDRNGSDGVLWRPSWTERAT
ncbi:MAG: hypothetical protein ACR2NR_03455 [Solirubrobacteraceae bacterium]